MPDNEVHSNVACRVVVIWIDWYAYHLARFSGLESVFGTEGEVIGLEMVGGVGVHAGYKFRAERSEGSHVETLLQQSDWSTAGKFSLARMVWNKLTKLGPETVLVPGYYTIPALAAALWAKFHRKQSVLMTESTVRDHERSAWKEAIKGTALRLLFDWAITGGQAHVRYLKDLGFPVDRIVGYYDVVGNEELARVTSDLRTCEIAASFALPDKYFLYVGRLASEKNVSGLVRAWTRYRDNGGSWSLVLVGDGPEMDTLRETASSSRWADDVIFAGHQSAATIAPYFAFATCFVLPSLREPWGLVVNEAMATGLPIVVSDRCGCAEDLVHEGHNGFIFDPQVEGHLAACLHKVEELPLAELFEMGSRSAEIIAPFSPANFGREIEKLTGSARLLAGRTHLRHSSEPRA